MLLVACAALMLNGCETFGGRSADDESASVEDRSARELEADDSGARTRGVRETDEFRGSPLDDPDGAREVRVIYFDYDKAEVRAEYRAPVQAHARHMARNPELLVTLEGHADERGSREYNLALGESRANAIRRQMVLLGASAGQIRVVSYGEERPVADGHDESAWSLNRRVEIIY